MKQEEFSYFLNTIKSSYGYDFSEYSEVSLKRRVVKFMSEKNFDSIKHLGNKILNEESLFEEFIQGMSVTVTEMFRDPSFYLSLRNKVLPQLATYPVIKIWMAGCATGEEVYSMAILLQEENLYNKSLIYATDINQQSIKTAKEGIYPINKMKGFTSNYIQSGGKESFSNYYKADSGAVLFNKSLRKNLVFAAHNLTSDKSFNEFQLILCRNVLIYFNQTLQNKIINLFYDSLCQFGILGLGNKESLLFTDKRRMFEEVDKKEKIFIKKAPHA
jgi:chemotaxis protein methyltransferase CheR